MQNMYGGCQHSILLDGLASRHGAPSSSPASRAATYVWWSTLLDGCALQQEQRAEAVGRQ